MKKNKFARRIAAIVLAGLMCFGVVAAALAAILPILTSKAAETSWEATESTPLVTSKDVYVEGEPVLVKALGSGKDWVAIYEINDVYPNIGSIYWYYVADYAAGEAVNIRGICETGADQTALGRVGLPAGEYKVILFANDGYEVIEQVNITIVEASETEAPAPDDTWEATPENPLVASKAVYDEGEPILVKALGAGEQWVGIMPKQPGFTFGANMSVYWYYVAMEGNTSGEAVTLQDTHGPQTFGEVAPYAELPAGEYTVVLTTDGGYTIQTQIDITIKEATSSDPAATSVSATYTSANAGKGRADGTLTITYSGTAPKSYLFRFANASGPIEGYTDIATIDCKGETTTYTMTPNTLIPVGADRILVYTKKGSTLSAEPAVAMLPAGAGDYDLGKIHQEFQVMSDIHLNNDANHPYNQQFSAALREIKQLSPDTLGVFINGDVADLGLESNYAAYQRILKAAGKGLDVYAAMGNHDFYCHKYGGPNLTDAEKIAQFMKGTGNDSETVYFDRWIGGTHFVFLGSEAYVPPNAQLSDAQLNWLKETLEKDKAEGRPVFLFLHEGIMDTVAGTMQYQGWHGVEQGKQLKEIIDAHPEVVMFSGHSHWVLESPVTILPGNGEAATHVSTSSCAYLWDDNANITNVGINGSQGWYIYLYDDCIVFRGRSFSTGEWISSAQFAIEWDFTGAWDEEPVDPLETTPDESGSGEQPVETNPEESTPDESLPAESGTGETAESTPDGAVEESGAEIDSAVGTDASSDSAPADAASSDKGGCSSALAMGALASVLLVGMALLRRRED